VARRARRLPIASAGGAPDFAISQADWHRIERAYGVRLSENVRAAVDEVTKGFVRWEVFERKAEPMAKAQRLIKTLERAAGDFQNAMLRGDSDAARYGRLLISKHFQEPRLSEKPSLFYSLNAVLTSFRSACAIALRELEPPPSTRGLLGDFGAMPSFKEGEQWALWIRRLTEIADDNSLPSRVRKDAGNKSKSDKQSPFTLFVWELQKCLPQGCKYSTQSKSALAKAIVKGRRADVSLAKALWKTTL
jgi:hypothetical protein